MTPWTFASWPCWICWCHGNIMEYQLKVSAFLGRSWKSHINRRPTSLFPVGWLGWSDLWSELGWRMNQSNRPVNTKRLTKFSITSCRTLPGWRSWTHQWAVCPEWCDKTLPAGGANGATWWHHVTPQGLNGSGVRKRCRYRRAGWLISLVVGRGTALW